MLGTGYASPDLHPRLGAVAPEDHALHRRAALRELRDGFELPAPRDREDEHGIPRCHPVGLADQLSGEGAAEPPLCAFVNLHQDGGDLIAYWRLHCHPGIYLLHNGHDLAGHVILRHADVELRGIVSRHLSFGGIDVLKPWHGQAVLGNESSSGAHRHAHAAGEARAWHHSAGQHPRHAGHHSGESRRWHVHDGHVATAYEPALENRIHVLGEVLRARPKEALSRSLGEVLAVDEAVRYTDVLQAAIEDAWGAAEELDVALPLPEDR